MRDAKDAARAQPQQPKHVGSFFAPLGSIFPFFFSSYGKLGIEKRAISAEGISDPVPSRPVPSLPASRAHSAGSSVRVWTFVFLFHPLIDRAVRKERRVIKRSHSMFRADETNPTRSERSRLLAEIAPFAPHPSPHNFWGEEGGALDRMACMALSMRF